MAGPDPLGKRALYWMPVDEQSPAGHGERTRPAGRRALFSNALGDVADDSAVVGPDDPMPEDGRFTLSCSRCGGVQRIGLLDLLILQFPFGLFMPRGTFNHRMTCPSCHRRSWVSLTLTT